MRHPLGIIALGALLTAPITAGEGPWHADFDEAVEAAREQDKDLFVDFTGSDWCGWCIRLDEEVFAHEEFLTAAQEQYVLVKLDYPRSDEVKALVPNPRRNEELSSRYNISGFPTVLLMTADGDVFGQTGYQAGGPEAYVEHMGTLRSEGRPALQEVIDLAEAFEASEGEERLEMLGRVLDTLEGLGEGQPFASRLVEPAKTALELDADGELGLKRRAVVALLGLGQADEVIVQAAIDIDPQNEEGLREQVLSFFFDNVRDDESAGAACDALAAFDELGRIHDEELLFGFFFYAAYWNNGPLENEEKAQAFARRAKEIGTTDERRMSLIDEILGE